MKTKNPIVIAAALLLSVASTAKATPLHEEPTPKVELKYAGRIDNNPVFLLNINNADGSGNYLVSFTDLDGVTLYSETVYKGRFNKNFVIDRNDLGNTPVRVEISNRKGKTVVAFEINSDTRTLTENVVTRKL